MKERYFTHQDLEHQAADLFEKVTHGKKTRRLAYQPQKSALLVLDMQQYFLDASSHAFVPSSEAILEGILQLIEAYSSHGFPIIFTQHINTNKDAGMMSSWWKDLITARNPLNGVTPEIDLSLGTLIKKSQYDAFYRTDLDEILRGKDVTQVVTCGVMTHLCCETTARSAFMHGYQVFFPVDGTATYNLEYHLATLVNLAHGFASVVLMKDILEAVRGAHEG